MNGSKINSPDIVLLKEDRHIYIGTRLRENANHTPTFKGWKGVAKYMEPGFITKKSKVQ
jgi:hypothetical protein